MCFRNSITKLEVKVYYRWIFGIEQTLPLAQNVSNPADSRLASAVIRQVTAAIRHTSITGAVIALYSLTHILVHAVICGGLFYVLYFRLIYQHFTYLGRICPNLNLLKLFVLLFRKWDPWTWGCLPVADCRVNIFVSPSLKQLGGDLEDGLKTLLREWQPRREGSTRKTQAAWRPSLPALPSWIVRYSHP